jgi:hypothetical protein
MHKVIVRAARPYFVRNGRPTTLVRHLQRSDKGKILVWALFKYYAKHSERVNLGGLELQPKIDIEDYRWEPAETLLDRLRKAGL